MANTLEKALDTTADLTEKKVEKATWVGQISIHLPTLEIENQMFNMKAAKVEASLPKINVVKIDRASKQEILGKDVARLTAYEERVIEKEGKQVKERFNQKPLSYAEAKDKVRYIAEDGTQMLVSASTGRGYFLKDELLAAGKWVEIAAENVANLVDGEETGQFERTRKVEVSEDELGQPNVISLQKLSEYKITETYMLKPNTDDKVNESPRRVHDLVTWLQKKKLALLATFSWGKGFNYFTAVIYPYYDEESDKTWLLMGMSEGTMELDTTWAISAHDDEKPKTAKLLPAPKVGIAKKGKK